MPCDFQLRLSDTVRKIIVSAEINHVEVLRVSSTVNSFLNHLLRLGNHRVLLRDR